MKDEKKVITNEEVKAEENGVKLTDEELAEVNGGVNLERLTQMQDATSAYVAGKVICAAADAARTTGQVSLAADKIAAAYH